MPCASTTIHKMTRSAEFGLARLFRVGRFRGVDGDGLGDAANAELEGLASRSRPPAGTHAGAFPAPLPCRDRCQIPPPLPGPPEKYNCTPCRDRPKAHSSFIAGSFSSGGPTTVGAIGKSGAIGELDHSAE